MRQDAIPFALAEILLAANICAWLYNARPAGAFIAAGCMLLTWKLYQWAGQ